MSRTNVDQVCLFVLLTSLRHCRQEPRYQLRSERRVTQCRQCVGVCLQHFEDVNVRRHEGKVRVGVHHEPSKAVVVDIRKPVHVEAKDI